MQSIGRVTGVAASTAPYMRRLATDEDLRTDVADFVRAANTLMMHIRTDRRLRNDLGALISSLQSGAGHLRSEPQPSHYIRNLIIGTGMILIGAATAIVVGWPRARQGVTTVVGQTTSRANATVHDMRDRISRQGDRAA